MGVAGRPAALPDGLRGLWRVTGGDATALAKIFRSQLEITDLEGMRFDALEGGYVALRQEIDGVTNTWAALQGDEATVRGSGTVLARNDRSHFLGALVRSEIADVDLWLERGQVFHLKAMPEDSWLGWTEGAGENGHLFLLHREGAAPSWAVR